MSVAGKGRAGVEGGGQGRNKASRNVEQSMYNDEPGEKVIPSLITMPSLVSNLFI
jgi:hypothetical protein